MKSARGQEKEALSNETILWSFLHYSPTGKSLFLFILFLFFSFFLRGLAHSLDSVIVIYVFHPLICTIVNLSVLYFFLDSINPRVIGHDWLYRRRKECPKITMQKYCSRSELRNVLYKVRSPQGKALAYNVRVTELVRSMSDIHSVRAQLSWLQSLGKIRIYLGG